MEHFNFARVEYQLQFKIFTGIDVLVLVELLFFRNKKINILIQ